MIGNRRKSVVERWDLTSIDGVGGLGAVGERAEGERKTHVVCCDTLVAFLETLDEVAKLYVNFRRLAEATADRIKSLFKIDRKAFFETWGKGPAAEFLLDRDCCLFAPDGKFLEPQN